jgi:threonine/homoserine/homoserine lactone efflux protein
MFTQLLEQSVGRPLLYPAFEFKVIDPLHNARAWYFLYQPMGLFASSPRVPSFYDGCCRVICYSGTSGALRRCPQCRSRTQGGIGVVFWHRYGGVVHVLAAAVGLSALLVSSAVAYSVVKYTGAAYLIYLGIKKLREKPVTADQVNHVRPAPLRRVYTEGILVQILNPKTAIFFFAFLPQFVNPTRGSVTLQFFALGMVFTLTGLLSDSLWALTAGSAAGWLQRNRVYLRHQTHVSGTVYIGLGLATAVSGSRHK